jgi:hypothetical protein
MRGWLKVMLLLPLSAAPVAAQDGEMQDMVMSGPHITLTPMRELRAGDQARADSIVEIARAATEKYRDVAVAEADGFKRFAPTIKRQKIYHYTNRMAGLKARFAFDPARPTSLLYRDGPDGKLELVGVMYTAPASESLDDLDRRIPLSIARWHQHTNLCLPPEGTDMEAAVTGRHPEFGPRGSIATEDACRAAHGRWKTRMFNWMVHVNVFASDPAEVWRDEHGGMRHH